MSWDCRLEESAKRDLRDIGPAAAREILDFLDKRIVGASNPEQLSKPLRSGLKGFWRYRLRDFRIICRLENKMLIVVVVAVGHRSSVSED